MLRIYTRNMPEQQNPTVQGHHLFIEPPAECFSNLEKLIVNLAEQEGGPVFTPHITLLAGIVEPSVEVLRAKAEKIALATHPFQITFDSLGVEDAPFRALYVRVNPSRELSEMHRVALDTFAVTEVSEYMPHLSLLYGNYARAHKEKLLGDFAYLSDMHFPVTAISLYETMGPTSTWKKIDEYLLAS